MTPRTKPRAADAQASACACRRGGSDSAKRSRNVSPTLLGRCVVGLRWLVPAALLALMPKCPVCLAGYVALFTGVGLSITVASCLRTGLILLGASMLGWFTVQAIRTWLIGLRRQASAGGA